MPCYAQSQTMNYNKIIAFLAVLCSMSAITYYAWSNNADAAMWASFTCFLIALLTIRDDQFDKAQARIKELEGELDHMTRCAEIYRRQRNEAQTKLK